MPVAARQTKSPAHTAADSPAAGGVYELFPASEQVVLTQDRSCVGSPETSMLAAADGTGGLSGLVDRGRVSETMQTKVFGRLAAWQNWIFTRPNASGPDGALRRFGTGPKGDYDHRRI